MHEPDANTPPNFDPPSSDAFSLDTPLPPESDPSLTAPVGGKPPPPADSPTPAVDVDPFQTAAGPTPSAQPIPSMEQLDLADAQEVPGYEILGILGQGGMGVVYKARHLRMKRLVALKVIRHDRGISQEAIQRFNKEIEAAAQLTHPNVVMAFDADEVDGTLYFVMEYIEGIDLSRLVREKGPLPVAEACDYIRQAALGLQHAHERGMVHRDIKPSNLLLTHAEGLVKILDMGLARLQEPVDQPASQLTGSGMVVGTPDFISPEQARDSRAVDIRSDLYSLGCTLYFLLSNDVPFPDGTYTEKLLKHCMDDPRPLSKLRADVPPDVLAIVEKLMAKRPADRFQTPLELAQALEPFSLPPRSNSRTRVSIGGADEAWPTPTSAGAGGKPPGVISTELNLKGVKPSPTPPDETERLVSSPPRPRRPRRVLFSVLLVSLLAIMGGLIAYLQMTPAKGIASNAGYERPSEPASAPAPPQTTAAVPPTLPATKPAVEPTKPVPKKVDVPPPPPRPITGVLAHFEKPLKAGTLRTVLSGNGEWAVVGADGRVYVWPVPFSKPSDRPLATLNTLFPPTALAVLGDGSRVLMGRQADDPTTPAGKVPPVLNFVTFWDPKAATPERLLVGHKDTITAVALSSRGTLALSGGYDRTVRQWDLINRTPSTVLGEQEGRIGAVALSPDGRYALAGDWNGKVVLWDLENPKKPTVFSKHTNIITCVTFSHDGRFALSAAHDKLICLYDVEKREFVRSFKGHTDVIRSLAFCPDNVHFLSGSEDTSVRLWDAKTSEPLLGFTDHNVGVLSVAASADGKYAVFICADHTIRRLELPEKLP